MPQPITPTSPDRPAVPRQRDGSHPPSARTLREQDWRTLVGNYRLFTRLTVEASKHHRVEDADTLARHGALVEEELEHAAVERHVGPGRQAGDAVVPVHAVLAAALLDPQARGLEGHWWVAPCGRSERTSRTVGSCARCAVAPPLPPICPPGGGAAGSRLPPGAVPERMKALVSEPTRAFTAGVSDGARTRDTQDHNLVLYQLSYTHHVSPDGRSSAGRPGNGSHDTGDPQASDAAGGCCPGTPASSAANSSAKDAVTCAAAACAWDVEGPGPSTNSVCR
jgi:hypothetical protein